MNFWFHSPSRQRDWKVQEVFAGALSTREVTKPCEVTKLWVWSKEKTSSDGERSAHSLPSPALSSLLFVVDHSMFENLNTALTPKLPVKPLRPHLSRPTAPSSAAQGLREPGARTLGGAAVSTSRAWAKWWGLK